MTLPTAADLPVDVFDEQLRVLHGILGAIRGVVGEGAASALFRYGAFEEGKRMAQEHAVQDWEQAVALLERLVRLEATVHPATDHVDLDVQGGPVHRAGSPVLETLLLGIMEGLFSAVQHTPLKGHVLEVRPGGPLLRFSSAEAA